MELVFEREECLPEELEAVEEEEGTAGEMGREVEEEEVVVVDGEEEDGMAAQSPRRCVGGGW